MIVWLEPTGNSETDLARSLERSHSCGTRPVHPVDATWKRPSVSNGRFRPREFPSVLRCHRVQDKAQKQSATTRIGMIALRF